MNTNDSPTPTEDIASQIPIGPFKPIDIFNPGIPSTSVEDVARGISTGRVHILAFGVPPL